MSADLRYCVAAVMSVSCVLIGVVVAARAQGKSGAMSVDACGVATADELEAALGRRVRPAPIPASSPASIGVSFCMWATVDGRRTLSVSTYAPEAVKRTVSKDLRTFYESVKSSNANLTRRSAIVFPGIARHASYFVNPRDSGDVILILRQDCVVTINTSGMTKDEAQKVAAAAGK